MSFLEARNRIRWTPDETVLPMSSGRQGSRLFGIFAVLFGLAWCTACGLAIVFGTLQTGFRPGMTLLMLVMMLPGDGAVLIGIYQFRARRSVRIDRERVHVLERGWGRPREWSEPLANYRGVLRRVEHHSGARGSGGSTRYEVVLDHEDPRKSVMLFLSHGGLGIDGLLESSWQRFARLLDRPLLRESSAGIEARDVADLSRPLLERAGAVPHTPALPSGGTAPFGRMLQVAQEPEGVRIRFRHAWTAWRPLLGLVVSGGMLAVGRSFRAASPDEQGLRVFVLVMAGFSVLMLTGLVLSLLGSEELVITSDSVTYRRRPWRSRPTTIPLQDVLEIRLGSGVRDRQAFEALEICARDRMIRFGGGLPPGELARLRREVVRLVTGIESPQDGRGELQAGGTRWIERRTPESGRRQVTTAVIAVLGFATLFGAVLWGHPRRSAPPPRDAAGVSAPVAEPVSSAQPAAAPRAARARESFRRGLELLRGDDPRGAEVWLRRSLQDSQRAFGERSLESARRWAALADVYRALDRPDEARLCAERAAALLEEHQRRQAD